MARNNSRGTGAGLGGPTADNSRRLGKDGGGNTPVTGEKHDQSKAMRVSAESRFGSDIGPDQPTRQKGDGNTSVTGEMHGQSKAEKIPASRRW